jgi:hypothetical protein
MSHSWFALSLSAVLAACGSPKVNGDKGGAASDAYGARRGASVAELQAVQGPVAAALGLQSAPELARALAGVQAGQLGAGMGLQGMPDLTQAGAGAGLLGSGLGLQGMPDLTQAGAGAGMGLQGMPDLTQARAGVQTGPLGVQSETTLIKVADLANLPSMVAQLLGDSIAEPLKVLGESEELAAAWLVVAADLKPLLKSALEMGCVSPTSEGLAFRGCVVPLQQGILEGSVKLDGLLGLREGGLKLDLDVLESFEAAAAGGLVKLHLSGDLGLGDGVCKGLLQAEMGIEGTVGGEAIGLGLTEGLSLDLGYEAGQLVADVGSALATRHWSKRPDGQTPESLPDLAAKLELSSPGAGTIAFSP